MPSCVFSLLHGTYAVARLAADAPLPSWALTADGFVSITRTRDELSIVCAGRAVPADVRVEHGWRGIELHGPFAFDQVGILASFAVPLASSGIGIFAISTFDTDRVFVKQAQLDDAVSVLVAAGQTLAADVA